MMIACKKELLTPTERKLIKSPISKINYTEFLSSVDMRQLGILKQKFKTVESAERIMAIGDSQFMTDLAVYTDTIQKMETSVGVDYIFRMPLESPHSISFRNLTIHISNDHKANAFIATYTPSAKWIDEWKKKKSIKYEGDVSFAPLQMDAISLKEALTFKDSKAGDKLMSVGGRTMFVQVCDTYYVTTYSAYGCSNGGHMPWDTACVWNWEGSQVPSGDYRGGYTPNTQSFTVCTVVDTGNPGGGGWTGGGGSTPNPDPNYDPCNGGIPTVQIHFEKGTRLMALPPNGCDDNPPQIDPPNEPNITLEQSNLLANPLIAQDFSIKDYILNNPVLSSELHNLLLEDDYSYESQVAAAIMIKGLIANQINYPNAQTLYSSVSSVIANTHPDYGIYFATYFSTECAIIKFQHPDWPKWKVFYNASKELLHLTLDGVGLPFTVRSQI
ncbi:hypothetical protein DU508_09600 [Pedobacter chinensis]|uniref:Uncharacterized protein n=2 Tax=Pedobacter chinensis TaxID=2282421 RepID=A0A369PYT5_9SPHI|nr:hypothetical protein DU508_09600 [Pedobacter chinensis]